MKAASASLLPEAATGISSKLSLSLSSDRALSDTVGPGPPKTIIDILLSSCSDGAYPDHQWLNGC